MIVAEGADSTASQATRISATIDLAESAEQGLAVVRVTSVGMLGS